MTIDQLLWECFRHFAHLDEANASIHCALVRYSPITFRLAEALHAMDVYDDLAPENASLLRAVMDHRGAYAEDSGR